jgi:hypothetical protein
MPPLVRFLLRHALIGLVLAVVFVGALLAFDIARLGSLIMASPIGLIAVLVLTVSVGITFASVQMGFAIMLLADRDEDDGDGRRAPVARLLPARAPVALRRKPRAGAS